MPSWVLHVHTPTTVISAAQGSLPLSPWAVGGFAISVGTLALLSATSRRHSLMLPITLARGGAFAFVSSWSSFSLPGAGLDELLLRASRFDRDHLLPTRSRRCKIRPDPSPPLPCGLRPWGTSSVTFITRELFLNLSQGQATADFQGWELPCSWCPEHSPAPGSLRLAPEACQKVPPPSTCYYL